jgi:hypothetical protein
LHNDETSTWHPWWLLQATPFENSLFRLPLPCWESLHCAIIAMSDPRIDLVVSLATHGLHKWYFSEEEDAQNGTRRRNERILSRYKQFHVAGFARGRPGRSERGTFLDARCGATSNNTRKGAPTF